jgi:serine/threonine-protein kinase
MASVFRGRDTELRRDVAVKVLHPHLAKRRDVVARFQREARAVAALDHPHILRIHDVGAAGEPDENGIADPPYIVMELVGGGNLRDFLLDHGAPLGEIVAFMGMGLCAALEVAHEAGIVHRDVKPANVMIADSGRLVLSDFGVAQVEDGDSLVTQTGAVIGTPAFMSPEQALGDGADARSDLYSLGAALYRLATGALPFTGPAPRVMSAIAHEECTPPLRRNPAMGAGLARVIERLMKKKPDERYQTAEQARCALEEVVVTAGLSDADTELGDYFTGPGEYNADRKDAIVAATLAAARTAVESRAIPRALDLADRVLALEPEHPDALQLVETIGGEAPTRRWMWLAFAGAVAAAGLAVAVVGLSGGDAELAAVAADAGGEIVAPADATVVAAALPADAAPAPAVAVDARARRVVRRVPKKPRSAPDAAPRAVVAASIDAAAPPVKPPAKATVSFAMSAWCDVYVDGAPHGRARRGAKIEVTAAVHSFECTQGKGAPSWRKTVTLAAGEHRVLEGSLLAPIEVTVDVSGDHVRIRGKTYRNGTTASVAPGQHRVEVFDGDRRLGARTVRFTSGRACTLRDEPRFACSKD